MFFLKKFKKEMKQGVTDFKNIYFYKVFLK